MNLRAGAGLIPYYGYNNYGNGWTYGESSSGFGFKFGASAQYFFWENAYIEGSLDFALTKNFSESENFEYGKPVLYMKPGIAFGWQFRRDRETGIRLPGPGFPNIGETTTGESRETEGKKGNELLFSIGWAPMIPLYGKDGLYTHDPAADAIGDIKILNNFNPLGIDIRFAWFPFHWENNTLGFEVEFNILDYPGRKQNTEVNNPSTFELIMGETLLGVRYQRILAGMLYLNTRLAVGQSPGYYFEENPDEVYRPSDNNTFSIKTGASLQFFLWKDLYAEAAIDLTSIVSGKGSPRFYLKPGINIGWQFR
jgi:hypothetical protein